MDFETICPICGEPLNVDGEKTCDCITPEYYCDLCGEPLKLDEIEDDRCRECIRELEKF